MTRLPKLYPDHPWLRCAYVLADALALLWMALWVYIGHAIYSTVMALRVLATDSIALGQQANDGLTQLQQQISSLPLVGAQLGAYLTPLRRLPLAVIAHGRNEVAALQGLALTSAGVLAGSVLLMSLLLFIVGRAVLSRRFRAIDRLLRTPGHTASAASLQWLATRALYGLPYDRLTRYTTDPIGDWRAGRYDNLARAAIAGAGLDPQRYLSGNDATISEPRMVGVAE